MRNNAFTKLTQTPLRIFALGSLILHSLVLASWQTASWTMGQKNNVLSVTLTSEQANTASVEVQPMNQPQRLIRRHRANTAVNEPTPETVPASNPPDQGVALLASTQTSAHSMKPDNDLAKNTPQNSSQKTQNSPSPSAQISDEENQHNQAKAQIKARLNTDLARYFDYPHVARLRGWEGTVLLAFNVEANGRLEDIHIARSSGYAVLDDSALSALRKVERLVETTAWLQPRELTMQIPVIYRLRCANSAGCNESP